MIEWELICVMPPAVSKSVRVEPSMVLFIAFILFLPAVCVLSFLLMPSEQFSVTQSFETVGSDGFVRYDISVSDPSYLAFPYEVTYQWSPYTPSRIVLEKTSLSAVYLHSDGRLTTKDIPVEYGLMVLDKIVTQVPAKSDGGRLLRISGNVFIREPVGPDAISFVQIKPISKKFGLVSFNPGDRYRSVPTGQSYVVFELD